MENKKKLTKEQQTMLNNYNRARANDSHSLYCVYGSFSQYKARAFDDIKNEMLNNSGYGLYVTTAGTSFFTCAYCVDDENGTKLVYHTPTKKCEFYI